MNVFRYKGFIISLIEFYEEDGVYSITANNDEGAEIVATTETAEDIIPAIVREIDFIIGVYTI